MADVSLSVGGTKFGGWKTARVTRGIESLAGSFSLSASERWANQSKAWEINDGDECSVSVAGETVITGYVDQREPDYDENSHALTVGGRDKTGDLVDCSALLDKWEFENFDVVKLAKKLCAPFGIKVGVQPGLILPGGTISAAEKLHIQPGDTSFSVIDHACRLAGLLPVSDGDGGLVLCRAGAERATTALVEGKNIKSAKAKFDASGRFARYVVLGQHAASDEFFGASAAQVRGEATDPNVTRTERVLVVRPEGNVTVAAAKKRAQWEATVRAARAGEVTVVVQGWTQDDKSLWPVNALVSVKSPRLRIDGEMLISQATYEVSDSAGTITTLSLKRPDAFKPDPKVKGDNYWQEIERHGKGV